MVKMRKALASLLTITIIIAFSKANSIATQPQAVESFKLNENQQNYGSCSYTVEITTSCSSIRYTRDQISLAFGNAYGNQVYAARLDNPSSRAFERCSTDTFQMYGPCIDRICYAYLYRNGNDGWKPDKVTIYGHSSKAITFYFDVFIPKGHWYGVNVCRGASLSEA